MPVPGTHWIKDYVAPDTAPNHPGNDGASVASPMGNCPRCTKPVHHEDQASHHENFHLLQRADRAAGYSTSHASLKYSRNEVGFRRPGKHAR